MDDLKLIREFVGQHLNSMPITDTRDLFAAGYVNSLFAVQLVMWLERTFSFSMTDKDLDLENLRSIDRVARLVAAKRAAASGVAG
ncbi:acyl carrier protein [Plantactinospora sp. DSM 117369]